MEDLLRKFIETNIEELFKNYEIAGKEQIISYDNRSFGKIDLLLRRKTGNQFIVAEIKYNNTNEGSMTQLNKYFTYFVKKHKLDPNNVRRVLVDVHIPKDVQEICKYSNIECKIIPKETFERWRKQFSEKELSIDDQIIKILKSNDNPISTRKIALEIGRAWHTIAGHCLRLQLAGKIEETRLSRISFWRIKK